MRSVQSKRIKVKEFIFFFFFFSLIPKVEANTCFHHSVKVRRVEVILLERLVWEEKPLTCMQQFQPQCSRLWVQTIWSIATLTSVVLEDQNAQWPRKCSEFVKGRQSQTTNQPPPTSHTMFSFFFF